MRLVAALNDTVAAAMEAVARLIEEIGERNVSPSAGIALSLGRGARPLESFELTTGHLTVSWICAGGQTIVRSTEKHGRRRSLKPACPHDSVVGGEITGVG